MKRLSQFSAYARPDASLACQTAHGAIVTLAGVTLALFLFLSEVTHFRMLNRDTKMSVDLERRHDLTIFIDATMTAVPCAILSLDVADVSGTSDNDANTVSTGLHMDIHKYRLDSVGKKIAKSEYTTPSSVSTSGGFGAMFNIDLPQAMKHVADMEEEASHQEGCHISGTMSVKRVAGRIRISAHQPMIFAMFPQLLQGHSLPKAINMSHTIHTLSFGPHFPGLINPLDHTTRLVGKEFRDFKYYIKVVPTEYYGRLGRVTETHQYSLTEYSTVSDTTRYQPAIDIMFDISPIIVTVHDHPPSFLHFLTRVCAVVGGVFAITRLIDGWVHWAVTIRGRSK